MFSDGPYGNLTHMQEFSLICHFFFFLLTSLITNIVHVSRIWIGVCFLNFFLFLRVNIHVKEFIFFHHLTNDFL